MKRGKWKKKLCAAGCRTNLWNRLLFSIWSWWKNNSGLFHQNYWLHYIVSQGKKTTQAYKVKTQMFHLTEIHPPRRRVACPLNIFRTIKHANVGSPHRSHNERNKDSRSPFMFSHFRQNKLARFGFFFLSAQRTLTKHKRETCPHTALNSTWNNTPCFWSQGSRLAQHISLRIKRELV